MITPSCATMQVLRQKLHRCQASLQRCNTSLATAGELPSRPLFLCPLTPWHAGGRTDLTQGSTACLQGSSSGCPLDLHEVVQVTQCKPSTMRGPVNIGHDIDAIGPNGVALIRGMAFSGYGAHLGEASDRAADSTGAALGAAQTHHRHQPGTLCSNKK